MEILKSILCVLILYLKLEFVLGYFEERQNLTFEIKAVYKRENVDFIGIRGNGLGLNWDASQPMTKTSEDGVSSFQVKFKTGFKGSKCMECSNPDKSFIPTGDDLEFRFYAIGNNGSESETAMVGNINRIKLPVSKVSTSFDVNPVFTYYPYFFTTEGKYVNLEVDSLTESLGKRNILVYLPPGMSENPKPIYDKYYMIDLGFPYVVTLFKPALDKIFRQGIAKDAIIIGHGDWKLDPIFGDIDADRTQQLTPVVGDQFVCKEGTPANACNGCVPPNVTSEEYVDLMTAGGCGKTVSWGGGADENIDFILGPVHTDVNAYLEDKYSSSITDAQEGTFVFGFSFGGLFSCYAAWTRPHSFGGAGCHSSSFWWPLIVTNESIISDNYFAKTVLNTHLNDRQPQKILIDIGEQEQDTVYQMVVFTELVYDIIGVHPMFVRDENLWLQIFPEKFHTWESWENKLWSLFSLLSADRS